MSRQQIDQAREKSTTHGKDQGLTILSYLLAGIGLYGGLGWLADQLLNTSFLMVLGFILGLIVSFYIIIKRFGGVA